MDSFIEFHSKSTGIYLKISKILKHLRSNYQEILIFENEYFGKVMVLDGMIMTTIKDEFIYHEMLVHVAMASHSNPRKILIIGGGDGGALREVLKYPVEQVYLVEIDEEVIKISKEFFKELSYSFEDERVSVFIEDAVEWIKKVDEKFDVILVDSTDPVGIAEGLISLKFINELKKITYENTIISIQSQSPFYHLETLIQIYKNFSRVFDNVRIYTAPIPTYPGGYWSFTISFNAFKEPKIRNRFKPKNLKFFNDDIYYSCFALPNFIEDSMK